MFKKSYNQIVSGMTKMIVELDRLRDANDELISTNMTKIIEIEAKNLALNLESTQAHTTATKLKELFGEGN